MQNNLDKRLVVLEQQRPDGVWTVEQMSDEQLIRLITGGRSTEMSDSELEQILREKALEVFDILAACGAGVVEDVMRGTPPVPLELSIDELSIGNLAGNF